MIDALLWFLARLAEAVPNLFRALLDPGSWLDWSDKEALLRFVYYGASVELFFVVLLLLLVLTAAGLVWKQVMWGVVRALEGFGNSVGRFMAWAGLLMVLQQILIVFVQRIFAKAQMSFGFGTSVSFDISWWSEELKLYNAIIVCLCCSYTFIQGGHVRVDLVYSAVGFRARRIIDMAGSVLFMMPLAVLIWLYAWFFMWRNLINPPVSASDTLERMLIKARAVRWSVETIGFSPNGFNAYFLFKVLMVVFAGMIFLQAIAFFYRSLLEFREGPEGEGRHLDRDDPEPQEPERGQAERLAHEGM